ncbi:hybrid sensor histidine kinase/response regulator [Pseudaquabacterium rugosum]|uniref:histidine kinase n=1 Tax=Pseudaquabacterium rugosum TaxID=2984194 RepID=A0ABU9B9S5_9BURK
MGPPDPELRGGTGVPVAAQDCFLELDVRRARAWLSPTLARWLGWTTGSGDVALHRLARRIHAADRQLWAEVWRARRDGATGTGGAAAGSWSHEMRLRDALGRWQRVSGLARWWRQPDGLRLTVHWQLDSGPPPPGAHEADAAEEPPELTIARLRLALRRAEQRRHAAERANAAKTRFLAHISHEIRTPLSGVLGLTELALQRAHSADLRRYLEQARLSGQALHQVISDVLDLSRIEAGHTELRPVEFDLGALLCEAVRGLLPLTRGATLMLLFDHEGPEATVRGDPGALRQIITNLVGNAIKYTPCGAVRVIARIRPCGHERLQLQLDVIDNGPGIPETLRPLLFEPFVRGRTPAVQGPEGAGLGLAIAQALTRATGGQLALLDSPVGAHFRLEVTLAQVGALRQAPARAQAAPAWLVFPDRDSGEHMARRLRRQGWDCTLLTDVAQAVALARQPWGERAPVVLLAEPALQRDVQLRPLREALPDSALYLLIRPDWHEPLLESQARTLGIQPLVAPLTPTELVHLQRAPETAPAPPPHTPARLQARSGAGPAGARSSRRVLLVEDDEVNQLVGSEFLRALGLQVQVAADGQAALAACAAPGGGLDLVLMDLQLPDIDGLQVTQMLLERQRRGQWVGAPIVALTAHATPEHQAACEAAGMAGMLTKPLSLDLLRRVLPRWL